MVDVSVHHETATALEAVERALREAVKAFEAAAQIVREAAQQLRQQPETSPPPSRHTRPGRRRPASNRGRTRSWAAAQREPFTMADAARALPDIELHELQAHVGVLVRLGELRRLQRGVYVAA